MNHKLRGELKNELTKREREVLDAFLVDGAMTKDLALSLGISYETARTHIDAVRQKLGYASRAEMAVLELRKRFVNDALKEAR